MLYLATLPAIRRVFLPCPASRLILTRLALTRLISSTPAIGAAAKASATKASKTSEPKKATKASTKPKAKTEKKKKKTTKAAKNPTFKASELRVPTKPRANAWSCFTKTNLSGTKKSVTEVQAEVKILADKWKNMTEAERKPFHDQAAEYKEKVAKHYEEWQNTLNPQIVRAINKKRKEKGKKRIVLPKIGPKKPMTSYIRFSMEFRQQQDSSVAPREATKRAAQAWRNLSEEQKKPYAEAYAKDHKIYLEQISASQAH